MADRPQDLTEVIDLVEGRESDIEEKQEPKRAMCPCVEYGRSIAERVDKVFCEEFPNEDDRAFARYMLGAAIVATTAMSEESPRKERKTARSLHVIMCANVARSQHNLWAKLFGVDLG